MTNVGWVQGGRAFMGLFKTPVWVIILAYYDVKIQSSYAKCLKVAAVQMCVLLWACVALPEEMSLGVKLSRQPEHSAVSVHQSALSPQKTFHTHLSSFTIVFMAPCLVRETQDTAAATPRSMHARTYSCMCRYTFTGDTEMSERIMLCKRINHKFT